MQAPDRASPVHENATDAAHRAGGRGGAARGGPAGGYAREHGDLLGNEFELYDAVEFRPPQGTFVLLRARGETLAGGALRRWADGTGEIKRMWTHPAHRGQGHGRRVLATPVRDARRGWRGTAYARARPDAGGRPGPARATAATRGSAPRRGPELVPS